MMESGKYGWEWHHESSKEASRNTPILRVTIYLSAPSEPPAFKQGKRHSFQSSCLIIKNNL
jgi:hypothetical protein